MQPPLNHCQVCAAPIEQRVPQGDHLPRAVCTACGHVHYVNPKVVTGCIPEWEGKILLCRRGIEPRLGHWTLPAGFLEMGESCAGGAARETWEEAQAKVEIGPLFSFINVLYIGQIHLFYRARMLSPDFAVTPESTELMLVDEADVPWDDLAFATVRYTLKRYFADRKAGAFGFHTEDFTHFPGRA
ncbi:MAG: NUDIX hydrolase [Oceanococcaceae bacterium]